ncbi:restriction endonuclease subunit S [Lactobacillus amylovorus]|uniref:restriction endonuclease subunit S n=1 Tax=Lactobacillus amylovorus TaxID=1604 RepID=UPI00233013C9|nr:restriction endonuclease subunit S [Lactobacillus amylovorus]MDB6239911.1 restriction endonuclease subunit S [Lactobacillus amylovorus]
MVTWEQQKLEKFVISDQAGKYIKKEKLGKGINYIGVQNLYDKDFIDKNDKFRLAPISESKYLLHKNDLLYAESSLVLGGIAKTIYVKELSAPLSFAWHTRKYTVKTQILPGFLVYDLNYKNHYNLTNKATQTALVGITKKDYFGINIKFPNIQEQNKILDILIKITNLISLQQRKLKELQQVKQTLSQFLLNGNTHTRPTLRLNGFEDIWKENKLKDIAKISMGQSPSSNNYNKKGNGKILIQGNADIDNGGIRPRVWTTEITKLANKNDILLTVRAPVGELAITNREVVIGRGIAAIKGNKFIYNLLVQKNKEHFWDRISSGSTFKSISSNDIKQLKVYIPSEKEETLIASVLETIKNKIDFQNERINVINKLKKYLLTNLFI